jgi:hypothetical protein
MITAHTSSDQTLSTEINDNSSDQVILDSLPYIDHIHPDYEEYALTLIEEEMQTMEPSPHALRHLHNPLQGEDALATPLFKHSKVGLNAAEFDALVSRGGQPRTDEIDFCTSIISQQYQPKSDSIDEWEKAIERCKAELEYERLRLVNAELQAEFDTSVWREHSAGLDLLLKQMTQKLEEQKLKVDQINAKRKAIQEGNGAPKLSALNHRWDELIRKNSHLSNAISKLEMEVKQYRDITGVNLQQEDTKMDTDDDL